MRAKASISTAALVCATVLAGCGSSSSSTSSPSGSSTQAAAPACTAASLKTLTPNTLTVATDTPAFPPYFENNKPSNGQGFESAVAFAVASKLGYSPSQVKWVVEPFNNSYAPGPKHFDFDVNEISVTPARAQVVDFSTPYFTAPQAVVVAKGSKYATATSLAALRGATLGVQVGTTSLQAVQSFVKPNSMPRIYNTSNDVVNALKVHQVEAIVTDLPTAFYITSAQVPTAKIVGQFSAPGGDKWGALLAKGSPLTSCVDTAIGKLQSSGQLAQITTRWMGGASAPELH
ncbi:MAG TPA: ABC transporter substrate-binding protein [Solirubrobacteraceae bacterium]